MIRQIDNAMHVSDIVGIELQEYEMEGPNFTSIIISPNFCFPGKLLSVVIKSWQRPANAFSHAVIMVINNGTRRSTVLSGKLSDSFFVSLLFIISLKIFLITVKP